MARVEGLRRIKLIGKISLLFGLAFLLLVITGGFILGQLFQGAPLLLAIIGIYLLMAGGIVMLGVWVAEGFLLSQTPPQ